jgi:glycosyltransferase involved in cell wall biosynthesis
MTSTVLLDATAIPQQRGGVGRYVEGLISGIQELGQASRLVVASQRRDVARCADLAPDATIVAVSGAVESRAARFAWEQSGLPALASRHHATVVHAPHYTMPLVSPVPVVCTLHDATFFTDVRLHSPLKSCFFRTWTRISARRAARVVVPSTATLDELTRVAGLESNRAVVAPHGVDQAVFHPPTPDEVLAFRRRHDLKGPYVAFLGTLEPRKNAPALVRGYTDAVAGSADPPVLVLAGAPGWDHEVEREVERALALRVPLRLTGYLPVAELRALLGGAEVVAYPSLGEGFGLPVLEAMACGAAVLTSRRLSLPEVGGKAVAYTGTAAAEIGARLSTLLDDHAERERLRAAAIERAGGFTWARSAAVHLQSYSDAAGGHG